jgi:hypothetical protein
MHNLVQPIQRVFASTKGSTITLTGFPSFIEYDQDGRMWLQILTPTKETPSILLEASGLPIQ